MGVYPMHIKFRVVEEHNFRLHKVKMSLMDNNHSMDSNLSMVNSHTFLLNQAHICNSPLMANHSMVNSHIILLSQHPRHICSNQLMVSLNTDNNHIILPNQCQCKDNIHHNNNNNIREMTHQ